MDPPTLLVIAARKVAEYILKGKYKGVDYELCDKGSNIIFDIVKEKKYYLETEEEEQIAEEILLKMVKPSKMNFKNNCCFKMKEWDLEMLREQNLVELKMGDMREYKDYIKEWDDETMERRRRTQPTAGKDYFDIIDLFNQNLNLETKTRLTKLDISKSHYDRLNHPFRENWTQAISQMLPNLKILKVSGQNLPSSEFRVLCNNFPNLISLDIAATGLVDLTGIVKLQNLEELVMGGLPIETEMNMNELYELRKLKKLDLNEEWNFSHRDNTVMTYFASSDQIISGLLEFDCSKSLIEQEQLDRIVQRHPTLKKIVANGVDGVAFNYGEIEILSDESIDSLMRSIDYFYAKGNHDRSFKNIFYLATRIYRAREPTIEILRSVIRKIYQLIPIYDYDETFLQSFSTLFYEATRPDLLLLYDNSDKRILLEIFLTLEDASGFLLVTEAPDPATWKRFNEIIRATENPQTDKIAARAIELFVAFDGKEVGLEFLEAMDQLKEKIDMEADEYKELDFRELIVGLEKIRTDRKEKEEIRQKAGRVMRFFEKFA